MNPDLLEILACPTCVSALKLVSDLEDEDGRILTGSLHCPTCNETYPIEEGIPDLLPRTPKT